MTGHEEQKKTDQTGSKLPFDHDVIRTSLRIEAFKIRDHGIPLRRLRAIRKALRTFNNLETLAVNVYKFQITQNMSEHNRELIAAMCNEMTHLQDFLVKLYEYSSRPSKVRLVWWLIGSALGYFSRLLGRTSVLKTGIWIEKKTIRHYQSLLNCVEWDSETRMIIEKNMADEHGHIHRWHELLISVEPDY